jgi:hypothetical protein
MEWLAFSCWLIGICVFVGLIVLNGWFYIKGYDFIVYDKNILLSAIFYIIAILLSMFLIFVFIGLENI